MFNVAQKTKNKFVRIEDKNVLVFLFTNPVNICEASITTRDDNNNCVYIWCRTTHLISLEFLYGLLEQLSILYPDGAEREVPLEYLRTYRHILF